MIIKLETRDEERACETINYLYSKAIEERSVYARNVLKECYAPDSWSIIKERMDTEGSAWYVWYMDGVREFMRRYP